MAEALARSPDFVVEIVSALVNWFEATYESEENVSLSESDLAALWPQRAMAVARLLRSPSRSAQPSAPTPDPARAILSAHAALKVLEHEQLTVAIVGAARSDSAKDKPAQDDRFKKMEKELSDNRATLQKMKRNNDQPAGARPPRHSTLDTRHSTPDTRHSTPDSRRPTLDTRHSTLDTRHSTPDTRHSTLDTRHSIPDTRHSTLDARRSTLPLTLDRRPPRVGGRHRQVAARRRVAAPRGAPRRRSAHLPVLLATS